MRRKEGQAIEATINHEGKVGDGQVLSWLSMERH